MCCFHTFCSLVLQQQYSSTLEVVLNGYIPVLRARVNVRAYTICRVVLAVFFCSAFFGLTSVSFLVVCLPGQAEEHVDEKREYRKCLVNVIIANHRTAVVIAQSSHRVR